jgi:hypothetical protein
LRFWATVVAARNISHERSRVLRIGQKGGYMYDFGGKDTPFLLKGKYKSRKSCLEAKKNAIKLLH